MTLELKVLLRSGIVETVVSTGMKKVPVPVQFKELYRTKFHRSGLFAVYFTRFQISVIP
jgi:hypothetical protein